MEVTQMTALPAATGRVGKLRCALQPKSTLAPNTRHKSMSALTADALLYLFTLQAYYTPFSKLLALPKPFHQRLLQDICIHTNRSS